jgi:ABC-2 type transport system permease protein
MRTEKGLLLKDWGLLKSQGKGIIYVMIGGAALMVGALNNSVIDREESAACFGIYITVTMAIYVANMLAYDEMDHGFQYLFSLPVTKKDYVREKYIFSISLDAAVWLLGLTITTVVSMIGNYGTDLKKLVMIMSWGMMAGVVLIALNIPVRLKFDGEKGRLIIAVIVLVLGSRSVDRKDVRKTGRESYRDISKNCFTECRTTARSRNDDTRYRSDCFVSMQHKNTGEERILKVE